MAVPLTKGERSGVKEIQETRKENGARRVMNGVQWLMGHLWGDIRQSM